MDLKIHLSHNRGFQWHADNGLYTKGYLYSSTNRYLTGEELHAYIASLENWRELLPHWNGCFAIVDTRKGFWAATDKLRSFPLFYSTLNNELLLTDDPNWIRQQLPNKGLDEVSANSLRSSAIVSGGHTIYHDISQLLACRTLSFVKGRPEVNIYYRHLHTYQLQDESAIYDRLKVVSKRMLERLIRSLDGRTAVIPLSGGYDSRYIAAGLKKKGYEQVICFSYGRPDSFEALTSQQVAKQLGYPWHFIEYTEPLLETFFSEEGKQYRDFAANFATIAHEQDWFAVGELKKRGLVPDDAVFVPGYSGDLLGGSYLPPDNAWNNLVTSNNGLADHIYRIKFQQFALPEYKAGIKERLTYEVSGHHVHDKDSFVSVFEHWFTINHVSKFIVNAVRSYEYWGYTWRIPLWDAELAEFWYKVPNRYRRNKELYNRFLENEYFIPLGVDTKPQHIDSYLTGDKPLARLRDLTPGPLRRWLKSLLVKESVRDMNNLGILAERFYTDTKDKSRITSRQSVNHTHACWYLEQIKQANLTR